MSDYIIEADGLEYCYPDDTKALQGVTLKIKRGSKVALLGANGAGKSTLFLHFNGILRPKTGKLYFNGQEVKYDKKTLLQLRKQVGIVFQDPDSQLFSASVYQEISFGPMNLGLAKEDVKKRVEQAMADTEISHIQDKPTHFLSYGQKKRVSIADILAMDPEVIICDEPNAWLDPKHSKQIEILFNEISQSGKTVILSTHDVDLAYSWADEVFVLDKGKIIGAGSPSEIFNDEILLKKASLEKPWLIEVASALIQSGIIQSTASIPRSKKELIKLINEINGCGGKEKQHDFSIIGDQRRNRDYISTGGEGL